MSMNGDPDPDPDPTEWSQFPLLEQQPLLRGAAYGPSQNEFSYDQTHGPLGPLVQGDMALSPNQQKNYGGLGSYVDAYGENGQLIAANQRIADSSYVSPHHPTFDTAEFWNGQDQGNIRLVPSLGGFGDQGYENSLNTWAAFPEVQIAPAAQPTSSPQAAQALNALGLQGLQAMIPQ
jgi:hypothetical protein